MDERTDGRTNGRTDGRTPGRTDGRTDGRTNERTTGRTDGRTGGGACLSNGSIDAEVAISRRSDINNFRRKLLAVFR